MSQDATHDDEAFVPEPDDQVESSVLEAASGRRAALNRIAVLEAREHVLSVDLAAVRADLANLRQRLEQIGNPSSVSPVTSDPRASDVVVEVVAVEEQASDKRVGDDSAAPESGPIAGATGGPVDWVIMDPLSPPASFAALTADVEDAVTASSSSPSVPTVASEIDDLIQQAVAARDRELSKPAEIQANAPVLPVQVEVDPTPSTENPDSSGEEKPPITTGLDDFFIGPSSPRKGRN